MGYLNSLLDLIKEWVWGLPLLILLVGTGLFYTLALKGLQFSKTFYAFKVLCTRDEHSKGDISQFSSLMLSIGATVGIGSIIGVAVAIVSGGPGSIFWMWVTGIVGMATKYAEGVLSLKYREIGQFGYKGGPMYYIKNGLHMPKLAYFFAIFTLIASFGIGSMTQANAVSSILLHHASMPAWLSGLIISSITGLILMGGIKSISKFSDYFAPFMVLLYVLTTIYIVAAHFSQACNALKLIVNSAFSPREAIGGTAGGVALLTIVQIGVSKGLFSNEAGMGSAAIVAAASKSAHPVKQALITMLQPLIITLVVCTSTALLVLMAPVHETFHDASLLTYESVRYFYPNGGWIVFASTIFFAYSTAVGWAYYGERSIEFTFGGDYIFYYRILYLVGIFVGSVTKLDFVWNFSDIANALMAIPNLIALLLLYKVVVAETKSYFNPQEEEVQHARKSPLTR
ncbi:D-alanine glycine permease DagA [Helicobacter heilmannii]|uniref:alanine/glycine:cation symporter family protein n=1 Tax=Helicobacter heilmannii TaxID=35817 RepID=UPI00244D8316|nr:sodium:alanine symporter family protein [Helicobacter heilmannii]GMB93985.1 D-alanine glycine permease DagA [Helicobacter heilmannii]